MAAPPDELASFASRHHDRLVGTLWLYCGDRAVAEELAQEALTRVCRDWEKVRRMDAPGAWLHRVAINLANSHYRRRSAERRARARHDNRAVVDLTRVDPDAADAVAVREAVAGLPDRQRSVVVLRYFADLTVEQTAEALGISESAVKSLMHRASKQLREALGDNGREVARV